MLLLSTSTDTRLGVKFTVTNMTVTGFSASVQINGKDYSLSPVANGATAFVTIPAADAQSIPTEYFGAKITVFDNGGKEYQESGWPGKVVSYAIDGLASDNIAYLQLAPPFPVPTGGGGGGGTVTSVNGETPDASGNVELPSSLIQELGWYDQISVAAADITAEIALSADTGNIYDLSQNDDQDDIAIKMPETPAAADEKVADVLVRIDTGASVPGLTFTPTTDVFCPMDGDDAWGTLTPDAMNFFSFTSMGTDGNGNRVWMVGRFAQAIS